VTLLLNRVCEIMSVLPKIFSKKSLAIVVDFFTRGLHTCSSVERLCQLGFLRQDNMQQEFAIWSCL